MRTDCPLEDEGRQDRPGDRENHDGSDETHHRHARHQRGGYQQADRRGSEEDSRTQQNSDHGTEPRGLYATPGRTTATTEASALALAQASNSRTRCGRRADSTSPNPTDGTRYRIRPDGLTINPPGGRAITEPI